VRVGLGGGIRRRDSPGNDTDSAERNARGQSTHKWAGFRLPGERDASGYSTEEWVDLRFPGERDARGYSIQERLHSRGVTSASVTAQVVGRSASLLIILDVVLLINFSVALHPASLGARQWCLANRSAAGHIAYLVEL
jgi:hypothetical protein